MARKEDERALRALGHIEIQARTEIVRDVAAQAATGDVDVQIMADYLGAKVRNMGRVSALELLARLGWFLVEQDEAGAHAAAV